MILKRSESNEEMLIVVAINSDFKKKIMKLNKLFLLRRIRSVFSNIIADVTKQ